MTRSVVSRAKELQLKASEQALQIERFQKAFKNLSKEQLQEVIALAQSHRERNKMAAVKTVERGVQSVDRGPER